MTNSISYIVVTDERVILGIFNDINKMHLFIENHINNALKLISTYGGNINKYKEHILDWRISCFDDVEIGNYTFDKQYRYVRSNKNIQNILMKLSLLELLTVQNKNNIFDEKILNSDINKIFISETEGTKCNVKIPINANDIKMIADRGTETLIRECLLSDNSQMTEADILKNKIQMLENKKKEHKMLLENKEKREKQRIERNVKLDKEREEEYQRKYLVDRKLYFTFKQEIADGMRNDKNIPPLFNKQWNIFTIMEGNGDIDTNNKHIDDNNSNIIQKELCAYKKLEANYKLNAIKTKFDDIFTSGEHKIFSQLIENKSDTDDSSVNDSEDSENSEFEDDSEDGNSNMVNINLTEILETNK